MYKRQDDNKKEIAGSQLREMVHRFPAVYKACLILINIASAISYTRTDRKMGYTKKLKSLKNRESGKRCFIVGNGPSLSAEDLEKIQAEDCFACNKIYKIFPYTKWRPRYYMVVDWKGAEAGSVHEMEAEMVFLGEYYARKNKIQRGNAIHFYSKRLLNLNKPDFPFSEQIDKRIYTGATVTYSMIQLAAYMGYSELYLLGMDHSFPRTEDEKGKIAVNAETRQFHFYCDGNSRNAANYLGMTNAYISAKKYCDKRKIRVINVTRGGKLEVFPRMPLEDVINRM